VEPINSTSFLATGILIISTFFVIEYCGVELLCFTKPFYGGNVMEKKYEDGIPVAKLNAITVERKARLLRIYSPDHPDYLRMTRDLDMAEAILNLGGKIFDLAFYGGEKGEMGSLSTDYFWKNFLRGKEDSIVVNFHKGSRAGRLRNRKDSIIEDGKIIAYNMRNEKIAEMPIV